MTNEPTRDEMKHLETQIQVMDSKLNRLEGIEQTLKEISKILSNQNTAVELLKRDVDENKAKNKELEKEIKQTKEETREYLRNIEDKVQKQAIKIGTLTAMVVAGIWIFETFFGKV